ncbi:Calmodulin-binding transcription activator [Thalictrum thalictroides]|uniref:Calmodulin-binding transcription activator n=1 Tax=Thalictrum thalictroides TaxID=46969 RepID=A0A7J6VJR9_THATH|nr:Calmodulin-binding transcription activator [Thalictrum thalictroides]
MAETRRLLLNQQLDITQILLEAQNRWLRPNEVCEILRNYKKFNLTPDPPYKPPGGSLFLFDRKALRYFRKDGHTWRKKKDGKTVREAHEKLKAGSVDVLHCYYAHGEDNENFQRRSYWMLDTQLEHIVLVHYREVKEGNRSATSRLLNQDPGTQTGSSQTCSPPVDSTVLTVHTSYASSPSTANYNGQTPYSEFLEDVESKEEIGASSLSEISTCSGCPNATLQIFDRTGFSTSRRNQFGSGYDGTYSIQSSDPPGLPDIHNSSKNTSCMLKQSFEDEQPRSADIVTRKITDIKLEPYNLLKDGFHGESMASPDTLVEALRRDSHTLFQEPNENANQVHFIPSENHMHKGTNGGFHISDEHDFHFLHPQYISGSHMNNGYDLGFGKAPIKEELHNDDLGGLKKLDSFGRWMNKEIGGDCDDSLMASDSGNYWNTLDTRNDDKEVSSLSRHMQLDNEALGPSLSQEQLFSIYDFSPDWAYSGVETKVLITGTFLGDSKRSRTSEWCCMFGEVEVPAEILSDNVLRCQAPLHTPGRVPFYITCSNRLACSEVREFEYRKNPPGGLPLAVTSEPDDEMRLQIRFAKMLCLGLNWKWLNCSIENCEKCNIKNDLFSTRHEGEKEWERIEKAHMSFERNHENCRDALIKKLLKDRLYEWLVCSVHEEGKGPHILDNEGLGVIHLAAALGYEWAMEPIVAVGVSPSFRDAHGRTGLHWAAYYGREEAVVALVKLGAAPGAVEDPTSIFPGGRTAADLASSRGYKGIAGYLAEADLASHLSALTVKESVMESVAATIAAEKAVENVEEQNVVLLDGDRDWQLSLKGSLAAVRKSAQAAALIQASFRSRSFQYRQLAKNHDSVYQLPSDIVAVASLTNKTRKMGHFSDYLHSAAVKIQQKYRGWKGRKEFLKTRNRIVKIQAHVRGHQVRKQYKKVIWSVSIVEKAILRWRRKGVGLRGFRADSAIGRSQTQIGKIDDYEFLRLGRKQKVAGVEKALARVQSMVRYPEARDQYMRLATNFQNSKIGGDCSTDEDLPELASMTF